MENQEIFLQLGTLGVVFIFAIREFFAWLRVRKSNGNGNMNKDILKQLELMNSNHLGSIENSITKGNAEIVNAIHSDNMQMVKLLGEISGKLNK